MRPIFRWMCRICEQAKLSNLGRYQSTRDTSAPNAFRESHCLVRILVWRNHRSILPKRSGHCHNRQRRALQIDDKQLLVKWMIWIPIICDSNRMALRATHRMSRWTFCTSDLRAWLSRAATTWTGHRDRAI